MSFLWGIVQLSLRGVLHRCACVELSTKGGIEPFSGSTKLTKRYRNDSIATSCDMVQLRTQAPTLWLFAYDWALCLLLLSTQSKPL